MERRSRSRSPGSPIQQKGWDSESSGDTENWTPDGSDSSQSDNSNDFAVGLPAQENTKAIKNCTRELQINTHATQATSTPSSRRAITPGMRWRALMQLPVEQFLKLEVIHEIIESLCNSDFLNVMELALNVEDLDFTIKRHVQYEVLCDSQQRRIDCLNHYLRDVGVETHEIKTDRKLALRIHLNHFCNRHPEKKRDMLRDQLRQVSTLKAFNALARQIWCLAPEERDKLGDEAIQYHEWRCEINPGYLGGWRPWRQGDYE